MFRKTVVLNVLENSLQSLAEFLFSNSNCPIYQLYVYWKLTRPKSFPLTVPWIFNVALRMSVVESFFSKETGKNSAFCNSVQNSITCMSRLQKVTRLENRANFLLTRVAEFQFTGCNATRDKLLSKFIKVVLKIWWNFQKQRCNMEDFLVNWRSINYSL